MQDALPGLKEGTKSQKVGLCFGICRTAKFCRVILDCQWLLLVKHKLVQFSIQV